MRTAGWETAPQSSEKLLRKSSGRMSIYGDFGEGEFNAIKHLLYKRFSAGHDVTKKGFSDFLNMKKCKN